MHPRPYPSVLDKSGLFQVGEMSRDFGLRLAEGGHKIANTQFPVGEKQEHPKADLFRKCFEYLYRLFHMICISAYTDILNLSSGTWIFE